MASNDDSWISFLVIAAGVIISIVQSMTKKKEPKKEVIPPIFEQDEEEEIEEAPIPSIYKPEPIIEKKDEPVMKSFSSMLKEEGGLTTETLDSKSEKQNVQETKKEEIEEEETESVAFDVRKAFIYSEIFNRKY